MAIGTNLPPQAYTRETLTQAFNWLQTQPEHIKRMAQSPDALIAIYSRNQRYGSANETDAPVSSQNFISDLKQLAEGLKQFDQPEAAATPQTPLMAQRPPAGASARLGMQTAPSVVVPPIGSATIPAAPAPSPAATAAANSGTPKGISKATTWAEALHPNSQAMIAQIKDQFNLVSDTEAANMMIAVAFKSLKNLI